MRPLTSDPTGLLVRAEEPATMVQARIVAVPHAGAWPNSVASWTGLVPPGTETIFALLLGRETRFAEVPLDDAVLAGARLAAAIAGLPPLPKIPLGYSMGALVCYLAAPQVARLRGLIVSGLNPPHLPDLCPRISALNDGDFLNALRDLGGLPPEQAEHYEMLALFLPVLCADFRLVEGYVHRPAPACGAAGGHGRKRRPPCDARGPGLGTSHGVTLSGAALCGGSFRHHGARRKLAGHALPRAGFHHGRAGCHSSPARSRHV